VGNVLIEVKDLTKDF